MGFLYQIWIINIDFSTIISFIIGILIGMVMLCLIYAIMVVVSLRDKKYAIKVQSNDLKAVEAEEMIHIAQATFLDKDLRGDTSKTAHFTQVSKDLVYGIASRFYPDSKYPLFELTIDECIELIGYVQERLNDILNNRILKIFKKFKASDIVNLTKATTAVVDSKAFELTKDVSKAISIGKKILNAVNVVWWGKKFITDVGLEIIMRKLYLVVIGIIGEEAYKIYSKSYKDSYEEIDSMVTELVESIDTDLKNAVNEKKAHDGIVTSMQGRINDSSCGKLKTRFLTQSVTKYIPYQSIFDKDYPKKNKQNEQFELMAVETGLAIRED